MITEEILKKSENTMDKLTPTIIQEERTKVVLMLGYMNQKALQKTEVTGWVYFWSRKRKRLWMKGESSGNKLKVINILRDCDKDSLLIQVHLVGKFVCHKGTRSCFSYPIK